MTSSITSQVVISTLPDVPAPKDRKMSIMRYLIQRELGQDVPTWVRARRAEGKTWPQVAEEMSAALRLPPDQVAQVSRQWLQKWVSRDSAATPEDEE